MEYFPSIAYFYQKYQPPPKPKIVGIDLGTTYSSIGTYHSVTGDVTVYEIEQSFKSIPSQIFFNKKGDIIVGYEAQLQAQIDPTNLLYDAKRFIGKNFTETELAHLIQLYPFDLQNHNERTYFQIKTAGMIGTDSINTLARTLNKLCSGIHHTQLFKNESSKIFLISPECVGAIIISKLIKIAEKMVGRKMDKGVIAVPADFNDAQESGTIVAARLAGVQILRVISEPTAAALSYGLHLKEDLNNVVVIDIGGGTTDISLLTLHGGMFFVRALAGNNRLGGQDFNERLLEYVIHESLKSKYGSGAKISRREDLERLKTGIERAKIALCSFNSIYNSSVQTYELALELHLSYAKENDNMDDTYMGGGEIGTRDVNNDQDLITERVNFTTLLTTKIFDEVNAVTVAKVIETLRECLHIGGIRFDSSDKEDTIQEVVLVGGSVKVPLVYRAIVDFFSGTTSSSSESIEDETHHDHTGTPNSRPTKPDRIVTNVQLSLEPELAVAKGVAIMGGIVGGAWPLTVSAIEPYPRRRKIVRRVDL
ncbi:heat shock 70 kDa protein 13-like isoform X2 [Gordionus sp. m RMFG-2023]|uniref:heat shock 70 kDa protein 13-like isoform X2 n=1 Tax=Gordionus sp. m RMFG-2023 TaxID=3053472 RepID=UPI0031FC31D1